MPVPSIASGPRAPRRGGSARRCGAARPRDADARCRATDELDACASRRAQRTAISPSKVNLKRVGQQVEDDLLPHVAVDVDRLGQRRAVDDEVAARPARRASGRSLARSAVRPARSVGSNEAWRRPASMREKSSRVLTSSQQPERVAVHERRELCSGRSGSVGSASAVLERPEHQRERRAELVADVAEERGLRAVELGERLGALSLLLVGAGVGHGGRDVAGDQVEEARGSRRRTRAVGLIPSTRTPAGCWPARARDRQNHGLVCRLVPGLPGRQSNDAPRSSTELGAPSAVATRPSGQPAASRSGHVHGERAGGRPGFQAGVRREVETLAGSSRR